MGSTAFTCCMMIDFKMSIDAGRESAARKYAAVHGIDIKDAKWSPYSSALASTCAVRSGLLRGKRSSRCRKCSCASDVICLRRPDDIAIRLGQVIVERQLGNAHHLADFFDRVLVFTAELQG